MRSLCSERFAAAFAPKTHTFGTKVIKAFAIPGVARLAVGSDIIDTLQLPDYRLVALTLNQDRNH